MQIEYTHQLVKRLGAKVFAVYFLMACAEQEGLVPITHKWLFEQMPYSTSVNTVTEALRTLTNPENQFAVRVTGGWRLATAVQLPLMNQLGDGFDIRISQREILNPVVVNVESEESRKNKSTSLTNRTQNLSERDFGKTRVTSIKAIVKDPDEIQACLDALRELKIYGKKAEKLAEDHHITVADIEAHWKVIQGQSWDNPQGMLIYMLESHAPIEPDSAEMPSANRYSMGVWEKESENE